MLKQRVIPCILLKDGGLVKTTKFGKPKYVGDPINTVRIFNDKEVDELLVLDIAASRNHRGPDYSMVGQLAEECFMPLTYGGGVSTVEDARQLFELGVEKVCVQTAFYDDLHLATRLADRFGSQSVVASVDVSRSRRGRQRLYSSARNRNVATPWEAYLRDVVGAGAGEVVVTAIDRDGTMIGMDLDLISEASNAVSVPVVVMGGVGSLADIQAAVHRGASAVAAGAFFVFHGPHRAVLITYPRYEELQEILKP